MGARGWVRATLRLGALAAALGPGLAALGLARLAERGAGRRGREWSLAVVAGYCRVALRLIGLRVDRHGVPVAGPGLVVANHASWLDVIVLGAHARAVFVAKAEVAAWPGIGALARAAGTVFIRRDPRAARAQIWLLAARLRAGERLVVFPEGTSSDACRVLPFKPTLFEALRAPGLSAGAALQPASLRYHAPPEQDARFYGWWGNMAFGPHFLRVLGQAPQGRATLWFHPPIDTHTAAAGRKALARACECAVRAGFDRAQPAGGKRDSASATQ